MIEVILLVILFIIGIYFGSFFTLATYRLPKKENITHKHSYCPNCNHKLGILDLVPIFSYLFLGRKCRYCKNPIGIRYFLFELLTGLVFVLFGLSLRIDVYNLQTEKLVYIMLGILYFASLFILGGINKEKGILQKSVLYYGVSVVTAYIIYSCALNPVNVYKYAIYLFMMVILMISDTFLLKKNLKYNSTIQILILALYMLIFTGEYITIATFIFVILIIGIKNIMQYIKSFKSTKVVSKKAKEPIIFYICVANIIMLIGSNFLINYMMK